MMRLIGGKDFYDGAVPYDSDKERIFIRSQYKNNPIDIEELRFGRLAGFCSFVAPKEQNGAEKYRSSWEDVFVFQGKQFTVSEIYVIFAGKRYNGLELEISDYPSKSSHKFLWDKDSAVKYLDSLGVYMRTTSQFKYNGKFIKTFWDAKELDPSEYEYIVKNKILVAIARRRKYKENTWEVNTDSLKDINFIARMSPFQAYQELEMFLGTILVNDLDHMVKVSDKSLIAKHGFDKWSFRNKKHQAKPRH